MGRSPAYERVEGMWGNREVPPRQVLRRGSVGETWFPPRELAEGGRRSCALALVLGGEGVPALAQIREQAPDTVQPLRLRVHVRVVELALAEEVDRPQPERDLAVAHVEREQQLVEDRLGAAHPVARALSVAHSHRRRRLRQE